MSHDDFPTDDPAVVTCGLPYANGDLHIGHLRTYVGGDVYRRALERLGQETAFVSGSDMRRHPVAVNAEQEGSPRAVRARLARAVRRDVPEVQRRVRQLRPHPRRDEHGGDPTARP